MPLQPGTRLGPYEIVDALGAGGMGEVYRARDTRLDRTVAIKILPEHLSTSPEARERFQREARVVSSLNHPHICVLHDIGQQDGIDFLVMEYLEGETIASRLQRGPLPLDQLLACAIQISDALGSAHRRGVAHRDLKPGNIMLTRTGAKLLDFGLAKAVSPVAGFASAATLTMAAPVTATGSIVGTCQYMSPEQVQGAEADARSDIFAFGAVLYEMATGKKAFEGKSPISILSAILEKEPEPIHDLRPVAPPILDRLVKTCLAKDPEERWQSARDLRRELKWLADGGASPSVPESAPGRKRELLAWALSGVFLVAALILAVHFLGHGREQNATRFAVPPPEKASFDFSGPRGGPVTLSPDGRRLAFVATGADSKDLIWVRRLETLAAQPLAGTDGAIHPFWSPDGRKLGFFAGGKLKTIDAAGGPVQTLCDAPDGRGGSWNAEGVILFAPGTGGPIYRVSSTGGTPVAVTRLDKSVLHVAQDLPRQEGAHRWPQFLPDGRHFLFLAGNFGPYAPSTNNQICVGSLDSQESRALLHANSSPAYAPGPGGKAGYLLFVREGILMAARFDAKALELGGEPLPVAEQVEHYENSGKAVFAVSQNGVLAYHPDPGSTISELVWFDRSGQRLGSVGPPRAL